MIWPEISMLASIYRILYGGRWYCLSSSNLQNWRFIITAPKFHKASSRPKPYYIQSCYNKCKHDKSSSALCTYLLIYWGSYVPQLILLFYSFYTRLSHKVKRRLQRAWPSVTTNSPADTWLLPVAHLLAGVCLFSLLTAPFQLVEILRPAVYF